EGQVKSGVIARWTRKRMEAFITAFCKQVAEGTNEASLEANLTAIVEDDQKSQALFDAYRRVALSASPELGPRIIALVTARIVGESRQPTVEEDKIMMAAERMNDAELIE